MTCPKHCSCQTLAKWEGMRGGEGELEGDEIDIISTERPSTVRLP